MSIASTKKPTPCVRKIIAGLLGLLVAGQALALDPNKTVYQFNCQNWDRPVRFAFG